MRIDDLPTSGRIEDRRGGSSRFPGGRGGIGIGTIVVLGLLGWALGIDPRVLIQGAEEVSQSGGTQQQSDAGPTASTGAPSDAMGRFVSAILGSTEAQWTDIFAKAGKTYTPPTLVMFSGATQSGCGAARAAMGPFYCPLDQKVYLDTSFFEDLQRRFGACDVGSKTCQFSEAYVIAHEIGHHVQNQLGLLPQVQQAQRGMDQAEANSLQVREAAHGAGTFAGFGRNNEVFRRDPAILEVCDAERLAGRHYLAVDIRGLKNHRIECFGDELEFESLLACERNARSRDQGGCAD